MPLAEYYRPKAATLYQMPQRHQKRNPVVSRDELNMALRIEEAAQTLLADCLRQFEEGHPDLSRRLFDDGMFLLSDALKMRQTFMERIANAPGVILAC